MSETIRQSVPLPLGIGQSAAIEVHIDERGWGAAGPFVMTLPLIRKQLSQGVTLDEAKALYAALGTAIQIVTKRRKAVGV